MLEMDFLKALIASPTFLPGLIGVTMWFLLGVALLWTTLYCRSNRTKSIWLCLSNEQGSAGSADFVLTLPLFMSVIALFVQLALITNASLIVHYSAFAAARAARVHYWYVDVYEEAVIRYVTRDNVPAYIASIAAINGNNAQEAAENAAKYILISASPSNSAVPSSGFAPTKIINRVAKIYLDGERSAALLRQAKYAYDRENTVVDVDPAFMVKPLPYLVDLGFYSNSWPMTASVKFKQVLAVPVANILLGNRSGKNYFRWIEARVSVL